jgi:hypothetical protein
MDRKAAIAAYKEKKAAPGVYAIRCPAADLCWVGQASDLATIWNRISFMLRQGAHPNRLLQSTWSERQGQGFHCEPLESLDERVPAFAQDRALKERSIHWATALSALKI